MCLAEALLRIPDAATRDALIRDKISTGDWHAHLGRSPSLFVNAATWGLLLTGKLVATHSESGLSSALARLVGKGGEPLIRKGVDRGDAPDGRAVRHRRDDRRGARQRAAARGAGLSLLLRHARRSGAHRRTTRRATARAYEDAIDAIGRASAGRGIYAGPGHLDQALGAASALQPGADRARRRRALSGAEGARAAAPRRYDIGLNIDAEEADRLELSLDLLERLCFEPELAGWNGIGFVVQAYQKRCPFVIDWLVDLARRSRPSADGPPGQGRLLGQRDQARPGRRPRRLSGLHAQGLHRRRLPRLRAAPARRARRGLSAVRDPQRAHAGGDLRARRRRRLRRRPVRVPVPARHGRAALRAGRRHVADGKLGRPCRIYAPVGTHETLLAYLVRRLLENGANTSFVNRIADRDGADRRAGRGSGDDGRADRRERRRARIGRPHPAIAAAARALRRGAAQLARPRPRRRRRARARSPRPCRASRARRGRRRRCWRRRDGAARRRDGATPVRNPGRPRATSSATSATRRSPTSRRALAQRAARSARGAGRRRRPATRAAMLERAADSLEADLPRLLGLLAREAGKTYPNAHRRSARGGRLPALLRGRRRGATSAAATHRAARPGRLHQPLELPARDLHRPGRRGARRRQPGARQAGRADAADRRRDGARAACAPACRARRCSCCPGRGETVGAALVADARVQGVMFTGSTDVARLLQKSLAGALERRTAAPVPLIAETGGQNAMMVDSSALAEQVVERRRRLGLRQRRPALLGAARALPAGRRRRPHRRDAEGRDGREPDRRSATLAVDVGPVIDAEARAGDRGATSRAMRARGRQRVPGGARRRRRDRARHLRRADADRARPPRRARARGLRAGAARRPLPARAISTR